MIDIESIVIGMVMADPGDLGRAVEAGVSPTMFHTDGLGDVFAAMLEAEKAGRPFDLPAMGIAVPLMAMRLVQIAEEVPASQSITHYAREMVAADTQLRLARELGNLATRMAARKPFDNPAPLLAEATRLLASVGDAPEADGPVPMSEVINRVTQRLEEAITGKSLPAISTGLRVLDKALTGGWRPGKLYFPAARPGRGKTTFAVNAMNAATAAGKCFAFFTVEMQLEEIGQKKVSLTSQVKGTRLDRGDLTDDETNRLMFALEQLHGRQGWIDDTSRGSFPVIETRCRRLKRMGKLDGVFIDYLQLLKMPGRWASRVAELTEITGSMKRLAQELKVPIICLSTINREAEKYGAPGLNHLKDSGSIEQDADAVLIFHVNDDDKTEIIVAKNRHGRELTFTIDVDLSISLMRDGDGRDPQELADV